MMRAVEQNPGLSLRMTRRLLALVCFAGLSSTAYGQAEPTATRAGSLQIGATFNAANSDYTANRFRGYGVFSSFDFNYHLGVVAEFHQLSDPDSSQVTYQRSYEIGPRYVFHYRRFQPYVKGLFGRGVFNYPKVGQGLGANIAYNVAAGGAGVDYRLTRSFNLKVDYEYQDWIGFLPRGLTPSMIQLGAAYRFH